MADEQLFLEQSHSDRTAAQQLYQHYFPRVYAYVAYRIRNAAEVEDVVSSIFLKIVKGLKHFQFRGVESTAAWIFAIARNEVLDFYRQWRAGVEAVSLTAVADLPSSTHSLDETVTHQEAVASLYRLIQTLSPRHQDVILLKFFGGLRNKEVAAMLALDERSVAAYLCRGLEELNRKYQADAFQIAQEKPYE